MLDDIAAALKALAASLDTIRAIRASRGEGGKGTFGVEARVDALETATLQLSDALLAVVEVLNQRAEADIESLKRRHAVLSAKEAAIEAGTDPQIRALEVMADQLLAANEAFGVLAERVASLEAQAERGQEGE